ncbi:MAG: SMC-Scp complex subunit ScpB [Kiritimatiellae bacterium]|jgi:segregation and condensation protein B|nr:SMC-Scp complex subunit ScpB [Kiritimatiellia bacterium]
MSDEVKIPLPRSLQEIVGALLFASETPLTANEIRDGIRAVEPTEGENAEMMDVYRTCTSKEIAEALRGLEKALDVAGVGFSLVCSGNAYRLQSAPSCGRYVRALLKMDRPSRLGRASLETLAIIAYRQPLTKSEMEEIRGVDVSANIKTLMDMQLIRLVGKSELPGHPFLYGTTPLFLEHFGLSSLEQLNELDPTLQRSNPRKKALDYKRKQTEKPAAAEEEGEVSAETPSEESIQQTDEEVVISEPVVQEEDIERDEDDLFIDDTPDEFDDDDDDEFDDDDDDIEDEEEDEDEL